MSVRDQDYRSGLQAQGSVFGGACYVATATETAARGVDQSMSTLQNNENRLSGIAQRIESLRTRILGASAPTGKGGNLKEVNISCLDGDLTRIARNQSLHLDEIDAALSAIESWV